MTWTARNTGLDNRFDWWKTTTIADADITAVYQPLGSNTIARSYINIVNPGTNDASPVVAPNFSKTTGWGFTGTQHLTSGVTGNGSQTVICRITNPTTTRNTISGYDGASKDNWIEVDRDSDTSILFSRAYNITSNNNENITVTNAFDLVICMARNIPYIDGVAQAATGSLDTWSEGTWDIANNIVGGKFEGEILAWALYNKQLSSTEVSEVTTNLQVLTSANNPASGLDANYITQNPRTRSLNSTSHELLLATDDGIYHSLNGGRSWAKVILPDPSNAEFADSPAATVDELTFHWIDYSPADDTIILCLAVKPGTNRQWLYRTSDNLSTWISRGIVTA